MTYSNLVKQATKAGFEDYQGTYKYANDNDDTIITGMIFINTKANSLYNGECLDIYEDGTFDQYTQFKGQQPTFKFV